MSNETSKEQGHPHHHGTEWKLVINHEHHEWKDQYITGAQIRKIGNIPDGDEIFLAVQKPGVDELIANHSRVDLARPGIEHFYSKQEHHEYKIFVNTEPHDIKTHEVSYNEIVTLAFPDFPQHPERTYSVTYKKGPSSNPEGILSSGGKVKIKNEMTFKVKHTGQS